MSRSIPVAQVAETDEVRRQRIPPPVLGLTGRTGPEGLSILDEVGGEAGAAFWSAFRAAATWAAAGSRNDRDTSSNARVEGWPARVEPMDLPDDAAAALVTLGTLASHRGERLDIEAGRAAATLARWASEEGHRRTAAELAQLAAALSPFDPQLSLQASRATLTAGDGAHAELWLRRTIGLAQRSADWRTYLDAHFAYGSLLLGRGDRSGARRWLERAFRRASRQGLRAYIDRARYDLDLMDGRGTGNHALTPSREAV